jgi:hypothetical protein
MKNLMPAVFVATTILAGATAVQAMPVAPLQQDLNPQIIQVYGGCGYGWHRGPYGGCRPLYIALLAGIPDPMAGAVSPTDIFPVAE